MAKQTFTTGQVLTAAQMTSLQQTAMLGGAANAKTASYVLVAADAGDAITMSNASATTITVNTGLFAAGDIVTIINLGAGVSTITAGTATVSTSGSLALAQNQGGVLRFTSASAAIFFQFATPASGDIEGVTAGVGISGGGTSGTVTITNSMATAIDAKADLVAGTGADTFSRLAVGANGTVLTADSAETTGLKWAAPATPSSGLTFISKTSWSAAASHTVDSVFTSTYTNYLIVVENWIASAYANLPQLQLRYGANTETAAYYGTSFGAEVGAPTTIVGQDTNNAAEFNFYKFSGESQGTFLVFNIERVGTGSTIKAIWSGHGLTNTNGGQYKFGGTATTDRDYTGFVLKVSAGTSSGNVTVYGLAKV